MPCGVPWRPEEGARSSVAGVRGGCEPLDVDAGKIKMPSSKCARFRISVNLSSHKV